MKDQDYQELQLPRKLNRRQFIKSAVTIAGASLLAACGTESASQGTPFRTSTPSRIMPGLQTGAAGTAVPAGELSLEEFLALSSLLTGIDNLDPGLGQIYLQALQSGAQGGSTVAEVYSAASSGSNLPQDIDALQQGGFFDQEGVGELADTIIEMWYTGVYTQDDEDHVVTYVDALAWKALHFTKPTTVCGQFGFWSQEPRVSISPSVQYTPVPTPAEGG